MAQILVRNLEDEVVKRLKLRAQRKGHSLQAEVKSLLETAANMDMETAGKMLQIFRLRLQGQSFTESSDFVREDRDR